MDAQAGGGAWFEVRGSFAEHAHRVSQPIEGHGVHALAHHLLDDGDALPVLPHPVWFGVDPGESWKGMNQPL